MECIHPTGKLITSGFPAFVTGKCDVCKNMIAVSGVRMIEKPDVIQVYASAGMMELRKE